MDVNATTENLLKQESHFAFGKNWQVYTAKIGEPKIMQAVADLRHLAECERVGLHGSRLPRNRISMLSALLTKVKSTESWRRHSTVGVIS